MFVSLSVSLTSCSTEAIQQAFSADPQASQWSNSSAVPADSPTDLSYPQGQPSSISQPSIGQPSSISPSPSQPSPQPGDQDFVGPVALQAPPPPPKDTHQTSEVPAALKTYVKDIQRLEVVDLEEPNQPIERGTFAQWLVEINNRLYQDRPTQQIRLATPRQTPAFKDVPSSHPNFAYIQGLAEAGFIPSPLSGDEDQATFQPSQSLTREVLLSWKVPIDLRKILPSTTTTNVQKVWGFKDTSQISQPALSAIFADHDNGELANIRRLLGSALLLQPQQPVTQAEAAATLWFIGVAGEGYSAKDVLRAEQQNSSDTVSKSRDSD